MEYRRLGVSGLQVSVVGLGTNNFGGRVDVEKTARIVHQALDLGVNFFDTANNYGGGLSEEYLGRAIEGKREQAIIATKFGRPVGEGPNRSGASKRHIMVQVEASLRRLGSETIDLYQLHVHDPETPIEETLRALDDLVRQGKVRYIGCSQLSAWQACEAIWTSRFLNLNAFVSVQPYYNLLRRDVERELVPLCRAYGLGIIPYFPLESGVLTGKYRRGEPIPAGSRLAWRTDSQRFLNERNFQILESLDRFASERGRSMVELALAWLLSNPTVSTVIPGATDPSQVRDNVNAVGWRLTEEDLAEIDRITGPQPA
jgi:aryl-alcohol dehydrogenase-like predicted oxidoreductase